MRLVRVGENVVFRNTPVVYIQLQSLQFCKGWSVSIIQVL